jgi:hypothetical protein
MYVAIISIAQHASPNVSGHNEFARPSASSVSAGTWMMPGKICRYSDFPKSTSAGVSDWFSRSMLGGTGR